MSILRNEFVMKIYKPDNSKKVILIFIAIILSLCSCSCRQNKVDSVTLQINWYHGIEFAGFYAAEEQGFFADENLQVRIRERNSGTDFSFQGLFDKNDFAIIGEGPLRKMIASEAPVTAVMASMQISPITFFSLAESGIEKLSDFIGKKIAITGGNWRDILHKTLNNVGVDPSKIIEVEVDYDALEMLYTGEVDVWTGFAHNEPTEARLAGNEINLILPADYGIESYAGIIIVQEKTIENNPDLVARFVKASRKGWCYIIENPGEAAVIIYKKQPSKSLDFRELAIQALIPFIDTGYVPVGWIDEDRWKREMGDVYDPDNPGFTMKFIQTSEK